jgi:hypothetical protein
MSSKQSSSGSSRSSGVSSSLSSKRSIQAGIIGRRLTKPRLDAETQRRYDLLRTCLRKACALRDDLQGFDRILADHMRPLLSFESRVAQDHSQGAPLYKEVLDRMLASPHAVDLDLSDLKSAVDKVQLQFKRLQPLLAKVEERIEADIKEYLSEVREKLRGDRGGNGVALEDEGLLRELEVYGQLLWDSLMLKRANLVGCKMRIYQERMREIK